MLMIFTQALKDTDLWSLTSGAKISMEKCKHLHVCRKTRCQNLNIMYKNVNIENVKSLRNLGSIFDSRVTLIYIVNI